MQLQIRQVNSQGQVSVGKKFAGQNVRVEEYPDGSVLLTPVEIVSSFELNLMKDRMFQRCLREFDKWQSTQKPIETDLENLSSR